MSTSDKARTSEKAISNVFMSILVNFPCDSNIIDSEAYLRFHSDNKNVFELKMMYRGSAAVVTSSRYVIGT